MIRLALVLVLLLPAFAFAQQPPPSCEQSLAHTQARFELVSVGRESSENVAAQVTAGLRQQNSELQAKVRELEEKLKVRETQKEPAS